MIRRVFSTLLPVLIAIAVVGAAAAVSASPLLEHLHTISPTDAIGGGMMFAGFQFAIRPRTWEELNAISFPTSARQPECFADYLFDTQTYTDNATTRSTFFVTAQNDRNLSNFGGGALPEGQFFEIQSIMLDLFPSTGYVSTAAGGVTGLLDDLGQLLLTSRPILTISLNNKQYGQWPLSLAHQTGGPTGFGWGTFTAEESLQYGNNSVPDGGLFVGGSLIIPPKVGFSVVIEYAAAVNTAAGDFRQRLTLAGVTHRNVR
jgi:hypothetical protein